MNIAEKDIVVSGEEISSSGKEQIKITLTISKDGIIKDVELSGCQECELLFNAVIDSIKNKGIDCALILNVKSIAEETYGLSPEKKYCAEMIETAIKKSLGNYYTKIGIFKEEKSNCQCCCGCQK